VLGSVPTPTISPVTALSAARRFVVWQR